MTSEIVLSLEGAHASALCIDGNELYVGSEWSNDADQDPNAVYVLDRSTFAIRKRWKMPFLVSDLAVVGDTCYAALGPGRLARLYDRGLGSRHPAIEEVDANAPKLVTDGKELYWGTYFGAIYHLERGCIAKVSKPLQSIALDAEHIYAGYEDGKVRVFRRDDGKRLKLLSVGKYKAECTYGDRLFTANDEGTITRWSAAFASELTFEHDVSKSQWGLIGLDAFGDRVVSRTYEDVCVWTRDGTLVTRWASDKRSINDALVDGDSLLVSVDAQVVRIAL